MPVLVIIVRVGVEKKRLLGFGENAQRYQKEKIGVRMQRR